MISLRTIKNITQGLIYLLLATPLIIHSSLFFPFITGKALFFRFLVSLVGVGAAYLFLIDREYRPKINKIILVLGLLFVVVFLATIFGINPFNSFWSNYERMEGFVTYIYLAVYLFALTVLFKKEKDWLNLLRGSVGVSILVGLYALLQLFGWVTINQSGVRVDATFGNSAYLAVYMIFNFGFLCFLWAKQTKRDYVKNIGYALIGLLQLLTLYHTATRGAILGLVGGAIVGLVFLMLFNSGKIRKWSIGILFAILLVLGGFWTIKDAQFVHDSPVLSRFASISLSDTTTESRLTIWQMALKASLERPVLGYGPENFVFVFNKYYEPKLWPSEPWFDRAHNVVMDWLANTGFVGLTLYLLVFYFILDVIFKKRKEIGLLESSVLVGTLAAYFIHNLFVFDNLVSYQMVFLLIGLIIYYDDKGKEINIPVLKGVGSNLSIGFLLLVFAASTWFFVFVPFKGANNILSGLSLFSIQSQNPGSGFVDQNIYYFSEAIKSPTGRTQAREYLFNQAESVARLETISLDDKNKILSFAYEEANKQLESDKQNARFLLIFATFLNNVSRHDEAIDRLNQAKELSPAKQEILVELARSYFLRNKPGDIQSGLDSLKIAFDSSPDYDRVREIYGETLIQVGRVSEGQEILAPLKSAQ